MKKLPNFKGFSKLLPYMFSTDMIATNVLTKFCVLASTMGVQLALAHLEFVATCLYHPNLNESIDQIGASNLELGAFLKHCNNKSHALCSNRVGYPKARHPLSSHWL